jgi:hypothetical protein
MEKGGKTNVHTLEAGSRKVARSSGRTNKLTSQPQARRRNVRSCHKATKENTKTVFRMTFFVPPRGM